MSREPRHRPPRILVVDDEEPIREMLAEFLRREAYAVEVAQDGQAALERLRATCFDVVLTDLKMPRLGGIALLDAMAEQASGTLAVIMTGFGTVETAIDAMKRGAYDYILKPFKLDQVRHVIDRAVEKKQMEAENIRLREALSLYEVSEAISASLSLDETLDTLASSCLTVLGADWVSTWLDHGEAGWVEQRREQRAQRLGAAFGDMNRDAVVERLRTDSSVLAQGEEARRFFLGETGPFAALLAVPLRVQSRSIGFVAVASAAPGRQWEEGQRKLLSIVASRAAAAIENARLYGDQQAAFQRTIEGLAKAIDKMDRHTAGHSERVAGYAVGLARRLALAPQEVEVVRQTALMHDIGKIGCVLNLNRPGKLTVEEYETFKQHPTHGREILRPIRFLHPLIPGVHLHHERFDGQGYPLRLRGEEIPLVARIIAVADSYDAMTSVRSYRSPIPHELAKAEVDRCAGSQFDPDVARAFLAGIDELRAEMRARGERVPD